MKVLLISWIRSEMSMDILPLATFLYCSLANGLLLLSSVAAVFLTEALAAEPYFSEPGFLSYSSEAEYLRDYLILVLC